MGSTAPFREMTKPLKTERKVKTDVEEYAREETSAVVLRDDMNELGICGGGGGIG